MKTVTLDIRTGNVTEAGVVTLAERKSAMLSELADRRYKSESGGTVIGGSNIATDDKTRAVLTAAYARAKDNPAFAITNYKFAPGVFGPLDSATIIAVAEGVSAHVQLCFDNEAALSALIMAASDESILDAIDLDAGWPPVV